MTYLIGLVASGKMFSNMDAKVCIDSMKSTIPLSVANARFSAKYGQTVENPI